VKEFEHMPPRNPELPEGTDHIINGALETNGGGSAGSGFVGSAAGDDTGGLSAGGLSASAQGSSGGGSDFAGTSSSSFGGGQGGSIKAQLRDGATNIQQQAGDKVRAYAETGKTRASSALDDFSQVVNDAAATIDERLGSEYGEYARRAADAVSGFADQLRNKEVDQLFEDGRNLVRFTLVRLVKAGMETGSSRGGRDIDFQPDSSLGGSQTIGGQSGTSGI
jgi:hypothetical protein